MTKGLRWEIRVPRKRGDSYINSIPIGKHMGKIATYNHTFRWICSCGDLGEKVSSYSFAITQLKSHYEKVRDEMKKGK